MRKGISRRNLIKGSTAFGLTVFASPLKAAAPEPTAITPALIEAARGEGKMILYSSMDLPVGEKLGRAFEAQYPGIAVQIERSGSERLFQRVDQEFGSGIRAADVINSSDASAGWRHSYRRISRSISCRNIEIPTGCPRPRESGCRRWPITPIW
jgi:iron(III) transport system substrate-binding protein